MILLLRLSRRRTRPWARYETTMELTQWFSPAFVVLLWRRTNPRLDRLGDQVNGRIDRRSVVPAPTTRRGIMDHPVDDPAYKHLFSRPRMVRDLLDGFAARGWSGALDFDSLNPLPASYVSPDLRQRHGDLVWRCRFRDEGWLYVVLLLEFQSAVDRAMAVRMLTYIGLLYQKLIGEGVLRERAALPPVLPIVIYNGRRPWTAPADVAELIASGGAALARYQPSQRYFLLDEGRVGDEDLPPGNLVSALIALETNRDQARVPALPGR